MRSDQSPHPTSRHWKAHLFRSALAWLLLGASNAAHPATVIQTPGSANVVFEAEFVDKLIPGVKESWAVHADNDSSGKAILITDGTNDTSVAPDSFAQWRIRFTDAGTYFLYYRWRADPARTGGDVFTGNSAFIATHLGALSTPGVDARGDYVVSASNGGSAPTDNIYTWTREPDPTAYNIGAAELAGPVVFTIGSREAGLIFDRMVLSTVPDLTGAQLDALSNSETDQVVQSAADNFVAFEAETKAHTIPGVKESWTTKTDATASGGSALYADGTNDTSIAPDSFAQFQIQFSQAGSYSLYYRWRADEGRTGGDVFTANSSWIATHFGALSTPGVDARGDYVTSASNAATAPADNSYAWVREPDPTAYTVGAAELAGPVTLTIGSREAGMFIDRIVLSQTGDLTGAQLDALLNSGAKPVAPDVASAVGSASLDTITVKFTRALDPASVAAGDFHLTPALNVSSAQLDADDARVVHLVTAKQAEGTVYSLGVTGIKDAVGTVVGPNTKATFSAWKRVNGWVTKEIYFGITGATVADLTGSANFIAGKPDKVEWVRGFQLNQAPLTDNYGAKMSAFFQPASNGDYSLFYNNDDEAELQLSSDESEANLTSLGTFPLQATFDEAFSVPTGTLSAGQRYRLVGLLKQGGGDVYLNVAARKSDDATPAAELTPLSGDRVSTYINPDLGLVTFKQQPAPVTAPEGGRATFRVVAETLTGPVYYQWQADGVDILGATRVAYVTPVLTPAFSGRHYRCLVSVSGTTVPSADALLTVGPPQPSPQQPFIGINFVGGGTAGGGRLTSVDVAGEVLQENWNNADGFTFDNLPLVDAAGATTGVTLSEAEATEVWYTGTIATGDADGILMQGFVSAISSLDPVHFVLNHVPEGKYQVLVYSAGFDFSESYLEAIGLSAAGSPPTYHVHAETGLPYQKNPGFRRMTSTDPTNRQTGNYVQFDDVSPAPDGSVSVSIAWESTETGNTHQPAVNAIQLVKVVEVALPIVITGTSIDNGDLVATWTGGKGPFMVQGKLTLNDAQWLDLKSTADRSVRIPTTAPTGFLRVVDGANRVVKLYRASLDGAQEVPKVTTPAHGSGILVIDGSKATYTIGFEGLIGGVTNSHLHGPAPIGMATGVQIQFVFPAGVHSGVISGQAAISPAQVTMVDAGQTYFNIHTTSFGGGEIRGQVLAIP